MSETTERAALLELARWKSCAGDLWNNLENAREAGWAARDDAPMVQEAIDTYEHLAGL